MTVTQNGLGAVPLFVDEPAAAAAFYRDVLDLDPVYGDGVSTAFDLGGTLINLLAVSAAHELIGPAPVAPAGTGARMLFSLWVDDVDAVCADLTRRGVALLNGPMDRPWGKRTATFADPAGVVWEVAQDIPMAGGPAGAGGDQASAAQ